MINIKLSKRRKIIKQENITVRYWKEGTKEKVELTIENKKINLQLPFVKNQIVRMEITDTDFDTINYEIEETKKLDHLNIIIELEPKKAKEELKLLKKLIKNKKCIYHSEEIGKVKKISKEGDIRFKDIKAENVNHCSRNQFIYNGILYGLSNNGINCPICERLKIINNALEYK